MSNTNPPTVDEINDGTKVTATMWRDTTEPLNSHEQDASRHRERAREARADIRGKLDALSRLVGPGVALPIERRLEDHAEHIDEAHWFEHLRREELLAEVNQAAAYRDVLASEFILLLAELDRYVRRSRTEPSDRLSHWRALGQAEAARMDAPF